MYFYQPRRSHHGAADPVAGGRSPVVRGDGRPARHAADRGRAPCCRRRCTIWRRRRSASPSSRCRTTRASPTPASSPMPSASTSAPRRSATSRSISLLPAFRAGPVRQRRLQPAHHAGQRLSRPLHRFRGTVGHHQGPAGQETAYFKYLSMYYPYVLKKDPDTFVVQFGGGLSTAVALKSAPGSDRRRRQSRGADRVPRGQGPARLHRRHPQQSQGHRHRL